MQQVFYKVLKPYKNKFGVLRVAVFVNVHPFIHATYGVYSAVSRGTRTLVNDHQIEPRGIYVRPGSPSKDLITLAVEVVGKLMRS